MSQPDEDETMSTTLKIGQTLKGKLDSYTITQNLYNTVWKATSSRLRAERDILQRYQLRSSHIRPLLDEIDPDTPSHAIVLRWLDEDLQKVTRRRPIVGAKLRFIAKSVLEALQVLHEDGFVHCDVKPGNILVNYESGTDQISEVQLADFGSTLSKDSTNAKQGTQVGTPVYVGPEVFLELQWSTSLDIWSFGATLISLMYGDGFDVFDPHIPEDHDEYYAQILFKHHRVFGPFPLSYEEIADDLKIGAITMIMQNSPLETLCPFHRVVAKEISEDDKAFVLRIMKLDPRDRPTAKQLLEDVWFRRGDAS